MERPRPDDSGAETFYDMSGGVEPHGAYTGASAGDDDAYLRDLVLLREAFSDIGVDI